MEPLFCRAAPLGPQNAIGEPVLRPTPLSPDFDPLGFPRKVGPRLLVSAARYIRAAFRRKRRQVSRVARLRRPESPHNSAFFRSVRSIRKPTSLCEPPYSMRQSASNIVACSARSTRRLRKLRLPAFDKPEGPSSTNNLLHPDHPKAIRISRRSTWFRAPMLLGAHQIFRIGRRGRARSSEESQQSRPPAASHGLDAEASPPCVAASAPFRFRRLTGVPSGSPLQLTTALPEGASIVCGPSVCSV